MTTKKKKFIKDLSFDHAQGHVALVGPAVGGPANLQDYTIALKSGEGFTDEVIEKATKIQVTLSIEEYLTRFFDLYFDEAEVLATALGFTTEASEKETFDYAEDYRRYLDEKVGSIVVMKAIKEDNEFVDVISKMNGEQYLKFLQDQELLEKAFSKIAETKESGATAPDTQQIDVVEKFVGPSGSVTKKKENMQELELMQKSLDEQKLELNKALEQVELFKQEKKLTLVKSRKDKLVAVVKNKEQAEVLFKALVLVENDAEFEEVLKAISDIQSLADQSELFKSVGADGVPEVEYVKDITKSLTQRVKEKYKKAI